ncbi:hypothetical protein F4779DRAFT_613120 [Xylariaceae sp. FL0662B]|nr:hypothetical protein F4779DRAFT_613120 [Xylariaceae sp. FL0662B]
MFSLRSAKQAVGQSADKVLRDGYLRQGIVPVLAPRQLRQLPLHVEESARLPRPSDASFFFCSRESRPRADLRLTGLQWIGWCGVWVEIVQAGFTVLAPVSGEGKI